MYFSTIISQFCLCIRNFDISVIYCKHTKIVLNSPRHYRKTFRYSSLSSKRLLFYPIAPDALSATSYLLHSLSARSRYITIKTSTETLFMGSGLCVAVAIHHLYPLKQRLTAGHAHCRHAYIHQQRRSLLPSTTSNSAAARQCKQQQQMLYENSPLF